HLTEVDSIARYRQDEDLFIYFFFFQAEDGIRDLIVTGVQTCALPIFSERAEAKENRKIPWNAPLSRRMLAQGFAGGNEGRRKKRSEERRVGKECRYRWSPDD